MKKWSTKNIERELEKQERIVMKQHGESIRVYYGEKSVGFLDKEKNHEGKKVWSYSANGNSPVQSFTMLRNEEYEKRYGICILFRASFRRRIMEQAGGIQA